MKVSEIFGKNSPQSDKTFKPTAKSFNEYLGLSKAALSEMEEVVDSYSSVFDVPTLVGIEVEVENITKEMSIPKFWIPEADGSLRNHGKEFKSIPLDPEQAMWALASLWQVMYKASLKPEFSWRTSIHVHVNALGMEEEEFKKFLILSLIFENVFFELVGKERAQSNFCVPLCRSSVLSLIASYINGKTNLKGFFHSWNTGGGEHAHGIYKYADVNFSRLGDLGTVEFRHLGGTNNLSLVCKWVSILLQLYKSAVVMDMETIKKRINSLNTSKEYLSFMKEVFGPVNKFLPKENLTFLMEPTVTKVKEIFSSPPKFKVSGDGGVVGYAKHLHKKQGKAQPAKK